MISHQQLGQPGGRLVGQPAEHDVVHRGELAGDRRVEHRVAVPVDRGPPGRHRVEHLDRSGRRGSASARRPARPPPPPAPAPRPRSVLYGCQTCAASIALISAGVSADTFGRLAVDHDDPRPSPAGVTLDPPRAAPPVRATTARPWGRARRASTGTTSTACAASRSRWSRCSTCGSAGFPVGSTSSWRCRGSSSAGGCCARALTPGASLWPRARGHPAGPPAAARAGRRARRLGGADDPDPAGDPLGDVRRPEPGEPGLLPELGAGQHRVGLPARRRGGQSAAAHLVDVGAGPVLHRVPGADLRVRLRVPRASSASTCGSRSSCCSAR